MSDELRSAIRKALSKVGVIPAGYARLGKGDGTGTILRAIADRTCYYHNWQGAIPSYAPLAQELNILSFNSPYLEGVRVRLGYPAYAPDVLHIVGIENGEGSQAVGGLMPHEQLTAMTLNINLSNLVPLRVGATIPSGLSVYINPGLYFDPLTPKHRMYGGGTLDLTSVISALTSNTHQMILIYLNRQTGVISYASSTAVSGTSKEEFSAATYAAIAQYPPWQPLALIHCHNGQTTVEDTDFYRDIDPRPLFGQGLNLPYNALAGSGAPTATELTTAYGSPANVGAGFSAIVYRSGGVSYLAMSNGINWYVITGTLA